ncbi:MAG: Rpn family recombination-promoting nuclease/putative transposase [Moraxella sp.]|uniref:Rpn family recombination-promoting nuclease/putative transposase n=1 Tax=Moraxella sp. TaxID=479 RepID=UPI0026DD5DEC|nr:Rpn family recombination-promoting nuclease/putative transposase [Moraxella sp.]MDO4449464.1 Rpn family recombination-promoting nuclease/putative transposase [Moraxella sp.]
MKGRFLNPYTDFGFKKLFGEEASKPLLIDFLNSMLPTHHQIAQLNFKNNEQLGINDDDRKAVYDIYCESITGEKFIVELQRVKQRYFKERTLFYTTFPIREQTQKGNGWNYKLEAIYCISILDFTFDDTDKTLEESREVVHTVQLKNQNNRVFYDKLTFIYLEMPNFNKKEHELKTQLDKWLFFIKNLEELQNIPLIFKDSIVFHDAFIRAEVANLNDADHYNYMHSLKNYWDFMSAIDTYVAEGKKIGLEEGKIIGIELGIEQGKQLGIEQGEKQAKRLIITNLKTNGMNDEQIRQILSSTIDEWKELS